MAHTCNRFSSTFKENFGAMDTVSYNDFMSKRQDKLHQELSLVLSPGALPVLRNYAEKDLLREIEYQATQRQVFHDFIKDVMSAAETDFTRFVDSPQNVRMKGEKEGTNAERYFCEALSGVMWKILFGDVKRFLIHKRSWPSCANRDEQSKCKTEDITFTLHWYTSTGTVSPVIFC